VSKLTILIHSASVRLLTGRKMS